MAAGSPFAARAAASAGATARHLPPYLGGSPAASAAVRSASSASGVQKHRYAAPRSTS